MNTTQVRFLVGLVSIATMNVFCGEIAFGKSFLPNPVWAGVSVGAAPIGGLALNLDTGPILNQHMSLGIELYGIQNIGIRALSWENSNFMRGLHGGGKVLIAMGNIVFIEPGLEAGWNYRFRNKVDAGVGLNLVIGKTVGGSLKLTCGYLIQ